MPDFTKLSATNIDAGAGSPKEGGNKPKGFESGLHDVSISVVEDKGPMKNDDTWHMYRVVYEGVGGRSISDLVCVPTVDVMYNGRLNLFQKLQKWVKAIAGINLRSDNIVAELTKLFSKPEKLKGLRARIQVGYNGWHAQYVSRDVFLLANKKGEALAEDGSDEPIKFSTRAAAKEYAIESGVLDSYSPFKDFPDVLSTEAPSEPNDLSGLGVKKVSKKLNAFEE